MLYNDHINLLDLRYVQQLPEPNISAITYRNVLLMKPPVICLSVTDLQLENVHTMLYNNHHSFKILEIKVYVKKKTSLNLVYQLASIVMCYSGNHH